MFDVNTLTMGEVAKIEELSGQSIATIGDDDAPKGKALAAMVFVYRRRTDRAFTWNDALGMGFAEAQEILGLGGDNESTEASGPGSDDEAGPTVPARPRKRRATSD